MFLRSRGGISQGGERIRNERAWGSQTKAKSHKNIRQIEHRAPDGWGTRVREGGIISMNKKAKMDRRGVRQQQVGG